MIKQISYLDWKESFKKRPIETEEQYEINSIGIPTDIFKNFIKNWRKIKNV